MSIEQWISSYGYAAVLLGAFFEGETIMLVAGFFAHQGYLSLWGVMVSGLCGSMGSDQLFFYLGRAHGIAWLAKHPRWQHRIDRIRPIFDRHQASVLIGFRFMYGLRNATPFAIAMSGYPTRRFFIFNLIGAVIWAIMTAGAGYAFGQAAEAAIGRAHKYQMWIAGGIVVVMLTIWLINRWRCRRKMQAHMAEEAMQHQAP